ncbi:MAG: thiamine-phosphate pyrophosphorylase [Actinomycetota bacterium]|nr:thiamine-phosphate pyrophosphorylase [Actinomycetota bacterium]
MSVGRLHVITDTRPGRPTVEVVRAALSAGAPVVQVRAKQAGDRELFDLACRVVDLCRASGAQCLVDDRTDIALAAAAAGAHLGAQDLPVHAARRIVGPAFVLGATARDPAGARELVAQGATYLGVGPAHLTNTKAGLPEPLGPAGVGAVAGAVTVPVIAIGGVTADRVPALVAAGAHGVAVVTEVSDAADPAAAVSALLRALGDGAA